MVAASERASLSVFKSKSAVMFTIHLFIKVVKAL